MHDTHVKMKDGREYCGPVWAFNAINGYLTIPSATDDLLYFRDMESAVEKGGRETEATVGQDVDLLARAKKQGWNGT
jgi:hypothetical protein